jgi:mRNA-degrading endonuclease RelE of RelBE toxin-antitoxin system
LNSFTIDLGFPDFVHEYKLALKNYPTVKANIRETLAILEQDPTAGGDSIPGYSRALWKIRLGVRGKFGKRGGYRLIYHVDWERKVLTPVALYFKRDTPDLPVAEVTRRSKEVAAAIETKALPTPTPPGLDRPN